MWNFCLKSWPWHSHAAEKWHHCIAARDSVLMWGKGQVDLTANLFLEKEGSQNFLSPYFSWSLKNLLELRMEEALDSGTMGSFQNSRLCCWSLLYTRLQIMSHCLWNKDLSRHSHAHSYTVYAVSELQRQRWVTATGNTWPTRPKVCPFIGKVCRPLLYTIQSFGPMAVEHKNPASSRAFPACGSLASHFWYSRQLYFQDRKFYQLLLFLNQQ